MDDVLFFTTRGFSMWPFLKAGEKLIIKKVPVEKVRVGDLILYRSGKEYVCHRLVKKKISSQQALLYVRGDNSQSPPAAINRQMFVGKAVGLVRENSIINLEGVGQYCINCCILFIAPLLCRANKKIKLLHPRS